MLQLDPNNACAIHQLRALNEVKAGELDAEDWEEIDWRIEKVTENTMLRDFARLTPAEQLELLAKLGVRVASPQ